MGAIVLIMMLIALSSASEGRLDDDGDVADGTQLRGDRGVCNRRG